MPRLLHLLLLVQLEHLQLLVLLHAHRVLLDSSHQLEPLHALAVEWENIRLELLVQTVLQDRTILALTKLLALLVLPVTDAKQLDCQPPTHAQRVITNLWPLKQPARAAQLAISVQELAQSPPLSAQEERNQQPAHLHAQPAGQELNAQELLIPKLPAQLDISQLVEMKNVSLVLQTSHVLSLQKQPVLQDTSQLDLQRLVLNVQLAMTAL